MSDSAETSAEQDTQEPPAEPDPRPEPASAPLEDEPSDAQPEPPAAESPESPAAPVEGEVEPEAAPAPAAAPEEGAAEPVAAAADATAEGPPTEDRVLLVGPPQEFTVDSPEVKAMAADTGLSPEAALAIHLGQTTLKRALSNSRKRGDLYVFAAEHHLPHSLAGQVLKEQMSLDQAQVRARVIAARRATEAHCSFQAALEAGEPVFLGLHGQQEARARVKEVLRYDIKVEMGGEEKQFPKHEVKYLFKPSARKALQKALKADKALVKAPKGPITKVARRFKIADDELQRVIDLKSQLIVTLLEGERFQAEIELYSKYEIVLGLKDEESVVVFRHALENAEAVPLEEVLAAERYQKKMQKKSSQGSKPKVGKVKKKKKR